MTAKPPGLRLATNGGATAIPFRVGPDARDACAGGGGSLLRSGRSAPRAGAVKMTVRAGDGIPLLVGDGDGEPDGVARPDRGRLAAGRAGGDRGGRAGAVREGVVERLRAAARRGDRERSRRLAGDERRRGREAVGVGLLGGLARAAEEARGRARVGGGDREAHRRARHRVAVRVRHARLERLRVAAGDGGGLVERAGRRERCGQAVGRVDEVDLDGAVVGFGVDEVGALGVVGDERRRRRHSLRVGADEHAFAPLVANVPLAPVAGATKLT